MGFVEFKNKNIVFCPLDWGLGHTMRMIPLIEHYSKNNTVFVYSPDTHFEIIKLELSSKVKINHIKSKPILISYTNKGLTLFNLLIISFKLLKNYFYDLWFIKKIVKKHNINIIISDNRYGCRYNKVHSIIITHQLNIQLPAKLKIFKPIIDKINKFLLEKFDECWVPDVEHFPNYAGILSQNTLKLKNLKYIGILSRFIRFKNHNVKKTIFKYAIIISAPPPQNEVILNKVITKIKKYNEPVVVIKGVFTKEKKILKINNFTFYDFATSQELFEILNNSENIIASAGYTTLMDLITLNKKAYLIPTKGQKEQEYLSTYYKEKLNFFLFDEEFSFS
ncbi:MAG: hypothetical protein N3A01_04645 [Bacteroidales bacterium]|nr:hypothetical protein [Bacteroidales bacterium]